jgi:DNA polymerase I-like protein with 3'-5' exonuclease and polymerase domains
MYDIGWLRAEGVELKGRIADTMVAAPLLDENRFSYSLNNLGRDYLKEQKDERSLREAAQQMGLDPKSEMWKLPAHFVGRYAEQDAALTLRLWRHLSSLMADAEITSIFDLEMRVLKVCLAMRERGVRVDLEKADRVKDRLRREEEEVLLAVQKETGVDVNIWAAASVAKAFDALSLTYPRTPKSDAPSFTKNFLSTHDHPVAKAVVRARELNKARTTFIDSILKHTVNGRIHADIHQLRSDDGGTVTGRFCLHGDTELELDIGRVRIGDYNPTGSEKILTHTGTWHRVVRRIDKGREEMFCLRVSSGDSVKCTGSHRVLTPSGWRSVRDLSRGDAIYHVSVQEVLERRGALPQSRGDVRVLGKAGYSGCGEGLGDDHTQRAGGLETRPVPGSTTVGAGPAVLPLKARNQESYEGVVRGEAPELQGRSDLRPGRVRFSIAPDLVYGEDVEVRLQALGGDVRASGSSRPSGGDARSPHRRGQGEQQCGEPCLGDRFGASAFTRAVSVEEIEPVGIAQVWDIEVETDHSYIAHGLIHHNSYSSPNLQQIPSRDNEISPLIRGLFLPEPGEKWGSFDYSSQEPRIVVHYASLLKMRGADKFVEAYQEDPRSDFHQLAADIVGVPRKQAKTINLGLFYGMGVNKLGEQLGLDFESAKDLFSIYHDKVPFVKELTSRVSSIADSRGVIRTLLGRRCRFDKWEPRAFGSNKAYPHDEARQVYGDTTLLKRAFTYKALNRLIQGSAADQTKKAMVDLYDAGILPMIQIHDELALSVSSRQQALTIMDVMQGCVELSVPSVVDAELGPSWGEAKLSLDEAFPG